MKTLLKVFWQFKHTYENVLLRQNTFEIFLLGLFTPKSLLCFGIRLTIVITSVPFVPYYYAQTMVSTKDDLRPHRPPPLPLSVPCWRRHHRCHGCRVVVTIAAITIATATATAATVSVSAATRTELAAIATAFWLIVVCPLLPLLRPPLPALALAAVGCQPHCNCRCGRKPLPPAPSATNA